MAHDITQQGDNVNPHAGWLRERCLWALLLAGLVIAAVETQRPDHTGGLAKEAFFAHKIDWRGCGDIVCAGDSRVQAALTPEVMSDTLAGWRVLNFGFGGLGYSQTYLDALEQVLDPEGRRVLILGLNPANFTPGYVKKNHFTEYAASTSQQRWVWRQGGPLLKYTRAIRLSDLVELLRGRAQRPPGRQAYHGDGWFSTEQVPFDPRAEINKYQTFFDECNNGPVQDQWVLSFLERVRHWREQGVLVYAFRTPVCSELLELEDAHGGLDMDALAMDFEKAGGKWLDINPTAYQTYDGSHLDRGSAEKLSDEIAQTIQQHLATLEADEGLAQLSFGR